jgi:hypothetical protein
MKPNYGEKLKQFGDKAFNTAKEIETVKNLTLHFIASSLHLFNAFTDQPRL